MPMIKNSAMPSSRNRPARSTQDTTQCDPFALMGTVDDGISLSRQSKKNSLFGASKTQKSKSKKFDPDVNPFMSMGTGQNDYIPPGSSSESENNESEEYHTASSNTPPRTSYPLREIKIVATKSPTSSILRFTTPYTGLQTPPASVRRENPRIPGPWAPPKQTFISPAPPNRSQTASSGVPRRAQVSTITSSTGLQTPPASGKKKVARTFGATPVFKGAFDDDNDDNDFPPTPIKIRSKKRNTAVEGSSYSSQFEPFNSSTPSSSKSKNTVVTSRIAVKPDLHDTTRISTSAKSTVRKNEANHTLQRSNNTYWGLFTPEPTPVKQPVDYIRSSASSLLFQRPVVLDEQELSSTSGSSHEEFFCTFQTLPAKSVPLLRLATKEITIENKSFITYVTDNGDELDWFQALDTETIVRETVTRELLRMKGDPLLKDVTQGRILNYEMGLGKTHVALCVIAETIKQMNTLYKSKKSKPPRRPVLIVANKAVHQQWVDHASRLFGLKAAIYSEGRKKMPMNVDIIISNIHLIRNQHGRALELENSGLLWNPEVDAPFYQLTFLYLIVDEFHDHRNPETISATSLLSLKADHVLLLSGTPAQNKVDDLQVPISLLQHPSKRKSFHELERIEHKSKRKLKADQVIDVHPITDSLIEHIIITRRKGRSLPPRENLVVKVPLLPKETAAYNQISRNVKGIALFLKLRQGCLHPALIPEEVLQGSEDIGNTSSEAMEDVTEDFNIKIKEDNLPILELTSSEVDHDVRNDKYLSSKFRVTLGILRKIRKKRAEKTIIFSVFTSLLDILSQCLEGQGISHVTYNGKMKMYQRQQSLSTIATDDSCRVMLVSIKAGGTGLNITSCNNVIILDPWWNSCVEEQAISRVHRIGQKRAVTVFRLISPSTIEERICEIQDKKRAEIEDFMDKCDMITASEDSSRAPRVFK